MTDFDDFLTDRWTGRSASWQRRRRDRSRRDPLKARIGVAFLVFLLLVPVAMSLRDDRPAITGADVSGAVALLDPTALRSARPVEATDSVPETSLSPTVVTAPTPSATPIPVPLTEPTPSAVPTAAPNVTAAPAVVAAEPVAQAERACALWFTVRPGDFWIGLADASGVSLSELLEANQATTATKIHPGDEICLPQGARTPPSTTTTTAAAPTTTRPPAPSTTAAPSSTAAPTTTKAPTTTSAPTATNPNRTYSRDEVIQIIRDVWPDHLEEQALRIAQRESNYIPTAKNWCCYGVFQIYYSVHRGWLSGIGITSASQLYDPQLNVRAAYTLYQRAGGFGPWSQTAG